MNDAELERRFLDFVFTTDAVITTGAVAYFTRCTLKEADELLDRLARSGTIRIENDEHGEIFYVYPNRGRLAAPASTALAPIKPRAAQPPAVAALSATPMMHIGGTPTPPAPLPAPVPLALEQSGEQVRCPFCAETIFSVAKKCKHCGEILDPVLRAQTQLPVQVNVGVQNLVPARPVGKLLNPGAAALLSVFWPGAGQMYSGRIGAGLGWMFLTLAGYALIVPGIILHVLNIFSAASTARDENRKNGY